MTRPLQKLALIALLPMLMLPGLAAADCVKSKDTASACMAGTSWDPATGHCVAKPSS